MIKDLMIGLLSVALFLLATEDRTRNLPEGIMSQEIHHYHTDTIYLFDSLPFRNIEDYISFIKYIKTQNGVLDEDNEIVMKVMLNRCEWHRVTWERYYSTPKINNSESIRKLRDGTWIKTFDWDKISDLKLLQRALEVKAGKGTPVPSNVLYFHSHPEPWGKGVKKGIWNENNLWRKYRHKFFLEMNDPLNEKMLRGTGRVKEVLPE